MARMNFATQKKFHDYAERTARGYLWEGMLNPAFAAAAAMADAQR
jgi:hypothetical protein